MPVSTGNDSIGSESAQTPRPPGPVAVARGMLIGLSSRRLCGHWQPGPVWATVLGVKGGPGPGGLPLLLVSLNFNFKLG